MLHCPFCALPKFPGTIDYFAGEGHEHHYLRDIRIYRAPGPLYTNCSACAQSAILLYGPAVCYFCALPLLRSMPNWIYQVIWLAGYHPEQGFWPGQCDVGTYRLLYMKALEKFTKYGELTFSPSSIPAFIPGYEQSSLHRF